MFTKIGPRLFDALIKTASPTGGAVMVSLRLVLDLTFVFFAFPLTLFAWVGDDFFAYTQEHLLYTTTCLTLCICAVFHFLRIPCDSMSHVSRTKLARLSFASALGVILYLPMNALLSMDESFPIGVWSVLWMVLAIVHSGTRLIAWGGRIFATVFVPHMIAWASNIRTPLSLYVCEGSNGEHASFITNLQAEQALPQKKWYAKSREMGGIIVTHPKDVCSIVEGAPAVCAFSNCVAWGKESLADIKSKALVISDLQSPHMAEMFKFAYTSGAHLLKSVAQDTADTAPLSLEDVCVAKIQGYERDITKHYNQKTVMLTYAGSNYAYALIVQLLNAQVKKLILLEHDDASLAQLRTRLRQEHPNILGRCIFHMGHISDHAFMEYVIQLEKPNIILHAPRVCSTFICGAASTMAFVRTFILSTEFLAYTAQNYGVAQCMLLMHFDKRDETLRFFIPLIKAAFMRYAKTGNTQYLMLQSDPGVDSIEDIQKHVARMRAVFNQSKTEAHDAYMDDYVPILNSAWSQAVVHALHVFKKSQDLMEYVTRAPTQLRWRDLIVLDIILRGDRFDQNIWDTVYPHDVPSKEREKTTKYPYIRAIEYTGWLENETLEHILHAAEQCDDTQLSHMLYTHETFLKEAA